MKKFILLTVLLLFVSMSVFAEIGPRIDNWLVFKHSSLDFKDIHAFSATGLYIGYIFSGGQYPDYVKEYTASIPGVKYSASTTIVCGWHLKNDKWLVTYDIVQLVPSFSRYPHSYQGRLGSTYYVAIQDRIYKGKELRSLNYFLDNRRDISFTFDTIWQFVKDDDVKVYYWELKKDNNMSINTNDMYLAEEVKDIYLLPWRDLDMEAHPNNEASITIMIESKKYGYHIYLKYSGYIQGGKNHLLIMTAAGITQRNYQFLQL